MKAARLRVPPAPITEQAALLERLVVIEAKVDRVLALLESRRGPLDPRLLLAAIYAAVGDLPFTAAELLEQSLLRADRALRQAIEAALSTPTPRRLGRLLRRLQGIDADGLLVHTTGDSRDGLEWRVLRVSNPVKSAH